MKLTFLGSGACFYPALHNTSAYFVIGRNLFLLDCGETVYETLLEKVDVSQFEQIYVIVTHLHADHVGSLGSMISYCTCILKKKICVVHPQNSICKLLTMMGIDAKFYSYREEMRDAVEGLTMKPIEVCHAEDMKCYGYEIAYGDWHIYYSGDASDIPAEILEQFLSGKIQKIYQDTASKESSHHMYVKRLEAAIPKEERNRVTCMHLDDDYAAELLEKGFCVAKAE